MTPQKISYSEIERLLIESPHIIVHDEALLSVKDLFDIQFPEKKDTKSEQEISEFVSSVTNDHINKWGNWFYYKWINTIVHFPSKEDLRSLRTSRNRNLITTDEQKKLYSKTILIAGMSVGSNVVEALVSQGIGGKLILMDMDVIEPSNLNRIRSPFHHVGLQKTEAIARKIYEIDPYLEVVQITEGVTEDNLPALVQEHSVDILIDEIDDLKMKLYIREVAKQYSLPVIMAADDGDNALIDIERYDTDSETKILSGRLPNEVIATIQKGGLTRPEQGIIIGKYFVGFEHVPLRMFESLAEVGKSLPSWPQLGGAAALSGVSLAYITRKIILDEEIQVGRVIVSLDDALDLEHTRDDYRDKVNSYIGMMSGEPGDK